MTEKNNLEKKEKKQKKLDDANLEKKSKGDENYESLVRISGFDIPGTKNIYAGLTRIKGISWAIANAICVRLKIPRNRKISTLSKEEIVNIEKFLKDIQFPDFMKNRRFDFETGKTSHLLGASMDIAREFDIKRMKKIKSYKGIRHTQGQPVRGQRTRSHFRRRGQAVGVRREKK